MYLFLSKRISEKKNELRLFETKFICVNVEGHFYFDTAMTIDSRNSVNIYIALIVFWDEISNFFIIIFFRKTYYLVYML